MYLAQTYYHAKTLVIRFSRDHTRQQRDGNARLTTQRRPSILWRSATRERVRRPAELSEDECSATPRLCCTISLRALERGCFSLTSPQRYTSCSESDSVTPDASFTTNEDTTTPYEVMDDDLLPEKSHNRDKALAHIKHLQHELSVLTTIMYTKNKNVKSINNHRQRNDKRTSPRGRNSTTPSRSPTRRKRKRPAQPTISHCPFEGSWLTDDNQVVGIDDGECSAFTNFQTKPETGTCSGTIMGYPEIYTGKLTKNLRTIKWSGGEEWTREDPKMDTKFGNKMGHKTKVGTRSKSTSSHCPTRHHKRSRSLSNITTLEPGDLNDILAHHKNQRTAAASQHRERTQRYHKTKAVDGPISRKRRVRVTTSIKVVPKWEHTTNLKNKHFPDVTLITWAW